MRVQKKTYYLVKGRLDLSTLDNGYETEVLEKSKSDIYAKSFSNIKETNISYFNNHDDEEHIKVYSDQNINDILKEMGEYFSGIN